MGEAIAGVDKRGTGGDRMRRNQQHIGAKHKRKQGHINQTQAVGCLFRYSAKPTSITRADRSRTQSAIEERGQKACVQSSSAGNSDDQSAWSRALGLCTVTKQILSTPK